MDPTDVITGLLEGLGGLSLFKAQNAEFSLFKLSNSPMNFGCVTHQDYSVQIYVEAPRVAPPQQGTPAQAQVPDLPAPDALAPKLPSRSRVEVQADALFSVDRTFDFDTTLSVPVRHARLNGVPVTLVKNQSVQLKLKELSLDLDLHLRDDALDIESETLKPVPVPNGFRVISASRRHRKVLQGNRICSFARGGRDCFGVFASQPGHRLPIGSDTVRFSKSTYSHVFALCRLRPTEDEAFILKSYQLIALQKEETNGHSV